MRKLEGGESGAGNGEPLSTSDSVVPILMSSIHFVPELDTPEALWRVPPNRRPTMFRATLHRMFATFCKFHRFVQRPGHAVLLYPYLKKAVAGPNRVQLDMNFILIPLV